MLFLRGHEFLIRKDALVQDIGRDDETRFAPRFLLDLRLLDADRCLDVPLQGGSRIFAGTSFARVMVLPAELRGRSSIRYVLPEDADKPKRQTYQLFVDDLIDC